MDLKWLIIGGIFLIVVVAFGRNPLEEEKRRSEEAMRGKDPLITSIEEYNSGKNRRGMGMGGMGFEGRPEGNMPRMRGAYMPPDGAVPVMPGGMQPYRQQQQWEVQPQQPAQQQPQGYYPPAPSKNSFSPRSDNSGTTPKFRDLSFYGTEVFTRDENGNKVLAPDGEYPIFDGKVKIIVRGGEKVGVVANTGS